MLSAEQSMGPIDILVCNAGSSTPGYFHDQDIEVFERMMKLNYMGSLHTVKAVYDGMVILVILYSSHRRWHSWASRGMQRMHRASMLSEAWLSASGMSFKARV